MKFTDSMKFTQPERHALLARVTQEYLPGSICEIRFARKDGKVPELYIQQGLVEDLIPIPATIEEYQRALHTFERFSAKWNGRGLQITLNTWKKDARPGDGL